MSRSHKKTSIFNIGRLQAGEQKKWKKQCNRYLRHNLPEKDIPDGTKYKKIHQTIWDSPSDGKAWCGDLICLPWWKKEKLTKKFMSK
jgi:hypothetical protein